MRNFYKIMFWISVALTVLAIIFIAIFGLQYGIDFKGGSVIELVFEAARPTATELEHAVSAVSEVTNVSVNLAGDKDAIVRLNDISEPAHQAILQQVAEKFGQVIEKRFDSIGPTIGSELRRKSITSIIILLLAVTFYIAFVFRKLSRVLSPWAVSLSAIAALIHDILIPTGIFAWLGHYYGIEVTAVFVAAALTILGYSLSDSVVVFDRVRENVLRLGHKDNFGELVHKSIMQTLVRSLNTTFATLLSLVSIYFFGGESIKYFALALILGIFCGAYSSFFVAAPILVWLSRKKKS
ncbi:MAG: protein-export membrane protein SecF [Candidatus Yanofskybacteria bacterium RIFCSPHIGHO2_01_FULL_44_17]|uniref:Protein-export membrane protein SecF n=1 Tax=Candidatus Yanofskybacteria bacterium RIFCSPHIGHO2_01_FULL_44_17 TaxID=1802668 RepID=A0A1F8ETV4_9BACT|nr:MAG: protein-export membrane protein SecF [Candidatus Yanofskybacteria bacterium RIFCSPHIGHO2_01_FULL_44_17]